MRNAFEQLVIRGMSVLKSWKCSNTFAQQESIRLRGWRCRANLRGVPTRGQGLYEFKHGHDAMPYQSLPAHVIECYESYVADGLAEGISFRGNNSAYRSRT